MPDQKKDFFSCFLVIWVFVGVPFQGQFLVSLLDVLFRGVLLETQYFIKVLTLKLITRLYKINK